MGIAESATLSRYENGHAPVSPELAQYLPEISNPVTDGDMALQMELADDDITEVRKL